MTKKRLEENMELQERISSTKAEVKTFVNYRHKYITINVGYLLDIIEQAERALKNADDLHVMDLQLASEQKEIKWLQDENETLSSALHDARHEVRVLKNKSDNLYKEYRDSIIVLTNKEAEEQLKWSKHSS